MKNNCYNCKYRQGVAGSAHSSCNSHLISSISNDILIAAMHAGVSGINKVISRFGIQSVTNNLDYFMFPIDFDPNWITGECNQHSNLSKEESLLMMLESGIVEITGIEKEVAVEKLKMIIAEKKLLSLDS